MTARAMWKGVIRFGTVAVAVKLYAAVRDRSVHFRLLHEKDHAPVRQALVNPDTHREVPYAETRRALAMPDGRLVVLREEELAAIEPEPSRDIRVLQFLPLGAIDHRWYRRPYYLGPDEGAEAQYLAFTAALAGTRREGLAQWVMRKKEYVGALRLQDGYPMLMALRHAEEVVSSEDLDVSGNARPDPRELDMAGKLVEMLADDFRPEDFRDEYRARVQALVEAKAEGGAVAPPARPPRRASEDLTEALQASLTQQRKRA